MATGGMPGQASQTCRTTCQRYARAASQTCRDVSLKGKLQRTGERTILPLLCLRRLCRTTEGDPAMTIARRELIDVSVTRWYHCLTAVSDVRSCSGRAS